MSLRWCVPVMSDPFADFDPPTADVEALLAWQDEHEWDPFGDPCAAVELDRLRSKQVAVSHAWAMRIRRELAA